MFGNYCRSFADEPALEVDRMTHYGERISQWFADIGLDPDDDEQIRLQKRLLVFSSVMIAAAGLAWGIVYFALGEPTGAFIPTSYSILSAISIATFRWLRRYRLFRTSQLALTLILPFALSVALGGLASSSGVILWSLTSPLGALVFAGQQSARRWFVAFLGAVATTALLEPLLSRESNMPSIAVTMFLVMNIVGVSSIAFVLLQYFTSQRETAFDLLSTEQETSEALLLNILPKQIADRLKHGATTIADHYEGASILFADVVDFTPMSAGMSPVDLVELLNEVFSYFDQVADEFGVEKIKTIGDCYMAASGVPHRRADHAHILARMALRIRDYVRANEFHGRQLSFRIGINSGPLVAGVIGRRKFIYDLWGDAVNTASRMESQGVSGTIQITESTFDLVGREFVCEPRGTVNVKGKGPMNVWHLVAEKA